MYAIATQNLDLLQQKIRLLYRAKTARVCLSSQSLAFDSTPETAFSSELLPINGYQRIKSALADTDPTKIGSSLELPAIRASFTASSGTLTWQSAFVILGGSDISAKSFVTADVNPTADTITLAAHGLVNGDRLMFSGDALPGGISAGVRYYVRAVSVNSVSLYTDAGLTALVNISSSGSGTMQARYASGTIAAIITESPAIALEPNQSYNYEVVLVER